MVIILTSAVVFHVLAKPQKSLLNFFKLVRGD